MNLHASLVHDNTTNIPDTLINIIFDCIFMVFTRHI